MSVRRIVRVLPLVAMLGCATPRAADAPPTRPSGALTSQRGDTSGPRPVATADAGAVADDAEQDDAVDPASLPATSRRCDARRGSAGGDARTVRVLRGRVSYYHDSLHGRRTASGERYDKHALTAASRELPFGTFVRVRRRDDPTRSVVVRVNDRGPFGRGGRILDLSRAAAECLDMVRRGVVEVRAEVLEGDD